jgi:hypothetical protein
MDEKEESQKQQQIELLVEAKCKKYACAFQYCLAKHNHDADRCRYHYDAYDRCAQAVRARETSGEATRR